MSRALVIVHSDADRERAAQWAEKSPVGTRIEFKAARRSTPQNALFWAHLTDIAQQVTWHGNKLRAAEWKTVFMAALRRELRLVPGIDGSSMVNLSNSSSDLSKGEMSDLLELIAEFGARHNVKFGDVQEGEA